MAQIEDPVTGRSATDEDSTQIRSDIERTRANMDETFDAIGEKLTPTELLKEGWSLFKGGSTAGSSKMLQVAREHPLPAAVIALGFGWLLLDSSRDRSDRRRYRRGATYGGRYGARGFSDTYGTGGTYGTTGASAGTYGEPDFAEGEEHGRLAGAKDAVADAAHTVREKAGDVKDRVGEAAGHARERVRYGASELSGRVRQGTRRARLGFWETLEERPLAVGVATLGLGLLVGLTIPGTRREDELFGETRDELLDQAKEAGREALDKGKQVARSVADTVQHEAEGQGLTPGGLADKVRSVAHEAKETVKEEAKRQNLTGTQQQGQTGGAQQTPTPAEPELAKR